MSARHRVTLLVGRRRLERLLRSVHQRAAQRHRADRALSRRGANCPETSSSAASCPHSASRCRSATCSTRGSPAGRASEGRSDVTALPYGPERAAHVHRRLPDHAADIPEDQGPAPRLAGGPRLGFIIGVIMLHRRLRRPHDPQIHAARGDAGHARRHLDRLHLDAAGLPEWEVPVDRLRFARHHAGEWTANVRLPWGMPGGLAAVVVGTVLAWLAAADQASSEVMDPHAVVAALHKFGLHVPIPSADFLGGSVRHRPASRHRHATRHLQLHRGHEQRRERICGRRQLQSAQDAAGRRHRRDRRLGARQPVPAGRLHRPPGMEVGRRAHRLFAGDRRRRSRWSASSA